MLSVQFLIADNKIGQYTRTDFANLCLLPKFLCRNACRGEDRLLLRNAEFHGLSHAVIQTVSYTHLTLPTNSLV